MMLGPKAQANIARLTEKPSPVISTSFADTTVAITCMYRFDMLERLLKSVRRFYPDIAIIVADNSFTLADWGSSDFARLRELCLEHHSELILLPFNSGCGATRNAAVLGCRTEYVIVCEEDFEFTEETDLEKLLRPVRSGQADCVGGLERYTDKAHFVHTVEGDPSIDTFQWTCRFELIGKLGERWVQRRPIYECDRAELSGVVCYRADVIHNFYAIKRAVYEKAPSDFRLKVDEHFDHFVRLKSIGAHVYYTPEVTVDHHSPAKHDDPRFAKVRCTGGHYHHFLDETWGLRPGEKTWQYRCTRVPYLRKTGTTPTYRSGQS